MGDDQPGADSLPAPVTVAIEIDPTDSVISRYASIVASQAVEGNFILSFYEVRVPVFLGSPAAQQEHMRAVKSVRAECVSRVIIPGERMEEVVHILNNTLEQYRAQHPQEA